MMTIPVHTAETPFRRQQQCVKSLYKQNAEETDVDLKSFITGDHARSAQQ